MNITLRPMTEGELAAWLPHDHESYVRTRIDNGEPEDLARRRAEQQYATFFPQNRPAAGHEVLVVHRDGVRLGVVWVGPHPQQPDASDTAWLYGLEVEPAYRGQGWGRAVLALAETHLADRGVSELGLNVFGDNHRARRLYSTSGYRETAVTMTKTLPGANTA